MTAKLWLCASMFIVIGCTKDEEKKQVDKPAPRPAAVVDRTATESAAPAAVDMAVTTSSYEARKEFALGRDRVDNLRTGESIAHFKKAIELDPEFALAHAYLAQVVPGAESDRHLAQALALASKASEGERQFIVSQDAFRAGDRPKAEAALRKVLEVAPGAWRVELLLAAADGGRGDDAGQIKRAERVLQVKPDSSVAYNMIAYANAARASWDVAIAAAQKQVELLPGEPNPSDTLGEMYLGAGRFEDAEKHFIAAQAINPKFTISWQGVGIARAHRGDYKGAYDALDKQRESDVPTERLDRYSDAAWIKFAEDKLPEALAKLDAIEKSPGVKALELHAFTALDRAHMLNYAGKYADAAKWYAIAVARAESKDGATKRNVLQGQRFGLLRLAAYKGKPDARSDKLVTEIEEQAQKNRGAQTEMAIAYARGLAAWAKKDLKGATAEMSKCEPRMLACRFDLTKVQRLAKDTVGADATASQIANLPRRDAISVYWRTHADKK